MVKPYSFDYEVSISGAKIVAIREPLMSNCRSDGEIDAEADRLIREINYFRERMKTANRAHDAMPLDVR